jgi:hypothetical protein
VDGVARSCVPDPDARLREILVQAIDVVAARTEPRADRAQELGGTAWAEACRLTGVAAGR